MKRTASIALLGVLLRAVAAGQGLSTFTGEARYEYQFVTLSRGAFSNSSSTHIPSFHIGTSGSLVSPSLFSFDLRTTISSNFSHYDNPAGDFSAKQYQWNFYDVTGTVLQNFPISTSFHLNDGITDFQSTSSSFSQERQRIRRQDQNVRFRTNGIEGIPTTTFAMYRTHQWDVTGSAPIDQIAKSYSLNMSSGSRGGVVNLSGSMSENYDQRSDVYSRYYSAAMQGSRAFSEERMLDFSVDYNKFEENTDIEGTATYTDATGEKLHYYSTAGAHNNAGPSYQSTVLTLGQSVHYIPNDNYRFVGSVSGLSGQDAFYYPGNTRQTKNSGGSLSASGLRSGSIGRFNISNGLSFGLNLQQYNELRTVLSGALTNGVQTSVLGYIVNANHGLSMSALRDGRNMNSIANSATVSVTGTLLSRFATQLTSNYHATTYYGDTYGYGNSQDAFLQWSLSGNFLYYIPFNVGANGSINWLITGYTGRLYRWSVFFQSPRFFLRMLSLHYRLGRSYEPIYGRSSITHNIEARYQWRAVAMQFQMSNYQLDQSQTQYWLIFSRPF